MVQERRLRALGFLLGSCVVVLASACVGQQELDPRGVQNGGAGGDDALEAGGGSLAGRGGEGGVPGGEGGVPGGEMMDAAEMPRMDAKALPDGAPPPEPDASQQVPSGNAKVVSVLPADNAIGVAEDSAIVITFDSPMQRSSTAAAISVGDRTSADFTYSWNAQDTVLTVMPKQLFEYAEGVLGATVTAKAYQVRLNNSAKDAAGRSLVEFQSSFRTKRVFRGEGVYYDQMSTTVSWSCPHSCESKTIYRGRLEGIGKAYGGEFLSGNDLCLGPTYIPPYYFHFWEEVLLTFTIVGLPTDFTVRTASLSVLQHTVSQTSLPGRKLATEVVVFDSLPSQTPYPSTTQAALSTGLNPEQSVVFPGSVLETGTKTVSVLGGARATLARNRARIQFRLRLDPETPWEPSEPVHHLSTCLSLPSLKFSVEVP